MWMSILSRDVLYLKILPLGENEFIQTVVHHNLFITLLFGSIA